MKKKYFFGWDIGGANTKLVVCDSDANIVSVKKHNINLWENFKNLEKFILSAYKDKPAESVINIVTITGESSDLFNNRKEGILKILRSVENFMKGKVFFYSKNNDFLNSEDVANNPDHFISTNWMLYKNIFSDIKDDLDMIIDVGSTTIDFIVNNDNFEHGLTDFDRLKNNTLKYVGVERTMLPMILDNLPFLGDKVNLVNENFCTTADIFYLTGDLKAEGIRSGSSDGRPFTSKNCMTRLSRILGADYDMNLTNEYFSLANYIKSKILDDIDTNIKLLLKNKKNINLMGVGQGAFLLKKICEKNMYKYISLLDKIDFENTYNISNEDIYENIPSLLLIKYFILK
tara:strand:- start:183 stop:1217 length:1035 start_codon:yes stop_codon:yes gene_type:complete